MKEQKKIDLAFTLGMILIFILIVLIIYIAFSVKIDSYKQCVNDNKIINIALIIEEEGKPYVTELYFYDPHTKKGSLLNIPENTGVLIENYNKIGPLESLYSSGDPSAYLNQIEELTDSKIDFYIQIDRAAFTALIDYLEGIEIFIPSKVAKSQGDESILLPSGSVVLDGEKSLSYLHYNNDGESISDGIRREHNLSFGLLDKMSKMSSKEFGDNFIIYIYPLLNTNLDKNSFKSFLKEIKSLDLSHLTYQEVLGPTRKVDSDYLLFPHYSGKLLKQTVKQIEDSLSNFDMLKEEKLVAAIEVQNGTTRSRLASKTAEIYKSFGYKIASVKNADLNNYEHTVILDKKGDPMAAQRVANIINCSRIHSSQEQNRDETVDIIIILGKDFDGRYVK